MKRGEEKRREREEEEGRKEEEKWKKRKGMELCMEIDIAWYGNFGKDACLEILSENTCLSWVRKTQTFQNTFVVLF